MKFSFFRDATVEVTAKLEVELRRQISDRDTLIAALRDENIQLRSKIERMELTLMPLSSRAGAAYVASLQPKPSSLPDSSKPANEQPMGWQETLRKYLQEQDELERQALQNQSQQEGNN